MAKGLGVCGKGERGGVDGGNGMAMNQEPNTVMESIKYLGTRWAGWVWPHCLPNASLGYISPIPNLMFVTCMCCSYANFD